MTQSQDAEHPKQNCQSNNEAVSVHGSGSSFQRSADKGAGGNRFLTAVGRACAGTKKRPRTDQVRARPGSIGTCPDLVRRAVQSWVRSSPDFPPGAGQPTTWCVAQEAFHASGHERAYANASSQALSPIMGRPDESSSTTTDTMIVDNNRNIVARRTSVYANAERSDEDFERGSSSSPPSPAHSGCEVHRRARPTLNLRCAMHHVRPTAWT